MNKKSLLFCCILISTFVVNAQFQNFADSYSTLSTIAGKGDIDDKSVNGWQESFENGNATDAELSRPHFAMADKAGNIYIADKDAHGIRKVTTDGKIVTVAGTNVAGDNGDGVGTECQLSAPNGLWVKEDGTVYILDLGNNKIRRLNTDGNLETIVDDTEGYSLGRGLWVTANEDTIFYASGSKVKMWTATSGISTYASGFSALGNIVQDKNGFLVVSDRGLNGVYRVSKDGESKDLIAGNNSSAGGGNGALATETALHGVRGVWFIEDNSYFVATHEGSQIWYIDVTGHIYLFLDGREGDSNYSGDGEDYRTPGYKISEARGISVDYDGNLIITENDRGFIRKIKNDYNYFYSSVNPGKSASKINVYPNPVKDRATISYELHSRSNVTVKLISVIGKTVSAREIDNQEPGSHKIDLETKDLPNGVYVYSVQIGNEKSFGRLIVE